MLSREGKIIFYFLVCMLSNIRNIDFNFLFIEIIFFVLFSKDYFKFLFGIIRILFFRFMKEK